MHEVTAYIAAEIFAVEINGGNRGEAACGSVGDAVAERADGEDATAGADGTAVGIELGLTDEEIAILTT